MDVYKECPKFENDRYILRLTVRGDCDGLLKVYSDKKAVPFFNGDNCHGDDFYYTTAERMLQALDFWAEAYSKGWFVRWSIIDKATGEAVGTATPTITLQIAVCFGWICAVTTKRRRTLKAYSRLSCARRLTCSVAQWSLRKPFRPRSNASPRLRAWALPRATKSPSS